MSEPPPPPTVDSSENPSDRLRAARESASQPVEPETELWQGRTHWKHYIGWIVGYAVVSLVAIVIVIARAGGTGVLWALVVDLILAILVFGRIAIAILGKKYRLTSERLFIHRGIVSETIDQIELIRVDDIRISKKLMDRILGLGTIDVLSTDFTDRQVRIDGVAGPEEVAELIRSRMRTARRKSLFVENL